MDTSAQPPAADWVTRELGARLLVRHGELHDQVALALRLNPRRAHLLVSTVLGKYVPTHPGSACQAGTMLGRQVAGCLGEEAQRCPVVVGYAETATALGHLVADVLGAPYLHSTRRALPGGLVSAAFTEPHSHAPEHRLLPARPEMLGGDGPLVLVDDELSTGTTAVNTIEAVHARYPRHRYVVASLLDVRSVADREAMATRVAALGARVEVVSLARGMVELPEDMVARSARLLAAHQRRAPAPPARPARAQLSRLHPAWPPGLPESGRHGFAPAHRSMLEAVVAQIAAKAAPLVRGRRVLVLGCEELRYVPLRVAEALQRCLAPGSEVRYASTARSPLLALDEVTYPIRTRGALLPTGPVLMVALPEPLVGPRFSTYSPDEVSWLLTDLSGEELEMPLAHREERIRAGEHYAESLPVEYRPSAEYLALFQVLLAQSARRTAYLVGVLTEMVLAARGYPMLDIAAFKGGRKGYRFSPGQRAAYVNALDEVSSRLLGRSLSTYQGDFLLVKCFFFLALMRPADPERHDKHIKWQYRRALFEMGLEQYESSCAIRTETFPTLAEFNSRLPQPLSSRPRS